MMSVQRPTDCGPPTITVGGMGMRGSPARTDDSLAVWSVRQMSAVRRQRGLSSPPLRDTLPFTARRPSALAALVTVPNMILTVAASTQVQFAVSALAKSKRELHAHSVAVIRAWSVGESKVTRAASPLPTNRQDNINGGGTKDGDCDSGDADGDDVGVDEGCADGKASGTFVG